MGIFNELAYAIIRVYVHSVIINFVMIAYYYKFDGIYEHRALSCRVEYDILAYNMFI